MWNIYHLCSETSLYAFIEASRGNMKTLRRMRWLPVSKNALTEAYALLMTEYVELCGERGKQKIMGSDVFLQRLQVMQLSGYINLHLSGHDAMNKISELCGECTIEEAKSTLDLWTLDLETAERQLEKELKKESSGNTFDLSGMTIDVSRHLGYQLDRRKTTVLEFAGCVVSLKKYIEMTKRSSDKKKS